jgi:hypothetical protein
MEGDGLVNNPKHGRCVNEALYYLMYRKAACAARSDVLVTDMQSSSCP